MGKDTLDGAIRGGLYRSESFGSFLKIYKDGCIYPRDEKNPSKWSNSYAQYIGAVALFDFKNSSDENFKFFRKDWYRFFSVEFMPVTIGIGLDWKALSPKIIPYDDERFRESIKLKKRLIPHVECWYTHYIKPSEESLTAALDKYTAWLDAQIEANLKTVDHPVDQAVFSGRG
ncbi:hypothetical protein ACFL2S_15460 [Thermodesulfobacteriota bacterium]